jgi:hypothetical protein
MRARLQQQKQQKKLPHGRSGNADLLQKHGW